MGISANCDLLNSFRTSKNLVLGFYGGGNYGDELLMEVLMNYFHENNIHVDFFYFNRVPYIKFHHNFSYINIVLSYKEFLKSSLLNKNIIFGGGGIFSEDMGIKHIIILVYLAFLKVFLRKKIYSIGIGFYPSTKNLNFLRLIFLFVHERIIVRDQTSYNVLRSPKVLLDNDVSFLLKDLKIESLYKEIYIHKNNQKYSFKDLYIKEKIIVFSIRRTVKNIENSYEQELLSLIQDYPDRKFILWEMLFPDSYRLMVQKFLSYENVYLLPNEYNPLDIFYTFKNYNEHLYFIVPQFHGYITAYLNNISNIPLYYSYKGRDLLESLNQEGINISTKNFKENLLKNYY